MQYHEIRSALHGHFSKLLAGRDRTMQTNGPLGPEDIAALENGRVLATEAIDGRNTLSLVRDDTDLLARFIAQYELPLQAESREYELFKAEFYKAYRDFCDTVLDRNQALARYDYQSSAEPKPQGKKAGSRAVSLQEAVQKFIAEEIRIGSWGKRTEYQNRQHLDFLQTLLGADTNVRDITTEDAVRVKDTLLRMPTNMNKSPKTRGKTLEEVLAMNHASKLNVRTVNLYLQTYSKMFGGAKKAKLTDDNPFIDLRIAENKRNTGKRLAFTPEQLRQIEASLLTGDPEHRPPKEAHRWAWSCPYLTGQSAIEFVLG